MKLKIFCGRSNPGLGQAIAGAAHTKLGQITINDFSDGETWVKYGDNIRGSDVFLIQSTNQPDTNLMELLIMIDAARRASAARVTAVIPYFGYARQDRKDQPRVSITAKLVANLITEAGTDRVITMDLHAAQIQGFFDIPVDHVFGSKVFQVVVKRLAQKVPNLAVASTDIGGIKMARAYAKRLGADLVIVDKRHPSQGSSEVMNIIGEVKGKNILFVDDLIDGGGTLTNGSVALQSTGAIDIYAIGTHPVLSGSAYERLEVAPIKQVWVSDTVPLRKTSPKIKVVSAGKLFAEAIIRSHQNRSISSLFVENKF